MQTPAERGMGEAQTRNDSDRELISRFLSARDESAFAQIASRYSRLVMSVAMHTLRDPHAAEDAFQATFLVLAKNARRIRNRDSLASWLHGTTFRVSQRLLRTRLRRKEQDLPSVELPSPIWATPAPPDQQVALDEELARLSEGLRAPLVLHYLEGRTVPEIARELKMSQSAVEGRLKRGKQTLRKRLLKRGVLLSSALHAGSLLIPAEAHVTATLLQATVAACLAATASTTLAPIAASTVTTVTQLALQEMATMTRIALMKMALLWAGVAGVVGLAGAGANGRLGTAWAGGEDVTPAVGSPTTTVGSDQIDLAPRTLDTTVAQASAVVPSVVETITIRETSTTPTAARRAAETALEKPATFQFKEIPPTHFIELIEKVLGSKVHVDADALGLATQLDARVSSDATERPFGAAIQSILSKVPGGPFAIRVEDDGLHIAAKPNRAAPTGLPDPVSPAAGGFGGLPGAEGGIGNATGGGRDAGFDASSAAPSRTGSSSPFGGTSGAPTSSEEQALQKQLATIREQAELINRLRDELITTQDKLNTEKQSSAAGRAGLGGGFGAMPGTTSGVGSAASNSGGGGFGGMSSGTAGSARGRSKPKSNASTGSGTGGGTASASQTVQAIHAANPREEQIRETLEKTVDFQFDGQTLDEVMKYLGSEYDIIIRLDTNNLNEAGVGPEQEISLVISGATLSEALNLMFENVAGTTLDYVVEDGVMKVMTAEKADTIMQTVIYDISALEIDATEISKILQKTASPASWEMNGGEGTITPLERSLIITTSRRVHEKTAKLLEMLQRRTDPNPAPGQPQSTQPSAPSNESISSAARSGPAVDPRSFALTGQPMFNGSDKRPNVVDFRHMSEMEARIQSALGTDVDLKFTGLSLTEAMQFLAVEHGINLKIDSAALSEVNVPQDTEIHFVASGLTLQNALGLMLKNVAGQKLDFVIENEVLVITSAKRAMATKETRIYDVRGITGDVKELVPLLSRWCVPRKPASSTAASPSPSRSRSIARFCRSSNC